VGWSTAWCSQLVACGLWLVSCRCLHRTWLPCCGAAPAAAAAAAAAARPRAPPPLAPPKSQTARTPPASHPFNTYHPLILRAGFPPELLLCDPDNQTYAALDFKKGVAETFLSYNVRLPRCAALQGVALLWAALYLLLGAMGHGRVLAPSQAASGGDGTHSPTRLRCTACRRRQRAALRSCTHLPRPPPSCFACSCTDAAGHLGSHQGGAGGRLEVPAARVVGGAAAGRHLAPAPLRPSLAAGARGGI
jgi:hypothetical protein